MSQSDHTLRTAEDLRILLWDIDGTLIRSTRIGAFKDYTIPVLEAVFGTAGRLAEMRVSGMTDLQIVGEALVHEGFTHAHVRERIGILCERYMEELRKATGNGAQMFQLLPGAKEALAALDAHPGFRSALLTGNIEPAAQLKMELVGLSRFFHYRGAFGDESHDRRDLPAIAADRISKQIGYSLSPSQLIVIGDTPNDIACARHFGARAVAVATGRLYSSDDLIRCKPDAILSDLSDTATVLETFTRVG